MADKTRAERIEEAATKFCDAARCSAVIGPHHEFQELEEALALPPDPPRDPDGYAYRYRYQLGGTVLRFNGGEEVNGGLPFEAVPYWLGPQPTRRDLCAKCGCDRNAHSAPDGGGCCGDFPPRKGWRDALWEMREFILDEPNDAGPSVSAMLDKIDRLLAAAPKPEPAEPAQDDDYRSLDHACEILRGCVAPYSGEQAYAVAKALKQWRDKWAAAVDCIHPDERQTIADLRAKLAAAEARIAEMRDVASFRSDYSGCLAALKRIAEMGGA